LRRWREDEVERTERAAFQVATHVDDKVTYDLRMTD
jgi:hypothetical protein